MYEVAVETADRSYYIDRLTELTGKPRIYWVKVPFQELKQIYMKESKGREVSFLNQQEAAILLLLMIPAAIICAVIDDWRERKEFSKWLKEGRWKFEKFKH